MATVPHVFDQQAMAQKQARAKSTGFADFLLQRVTDDLEERLSAVLRDFKAAADIGTPLPLARDMLSRHGGVGAVHRLSLLAETGSEPMPTGEALPLAPQSIDLAISLLALQAVNDLPGALIQIHRALRPDGLFIAALLGGQTLHELRQAFLMAETEIEGGASPRVAPFADVRDMGGLLQRAGFALPVTDSETVTVRYASPLGLLRDLRAMGLTNPLVARRRSFLRRTTLMRMVEIYAERFSDADGRVRATFEIIWLSGWAPHESQQKPLRPGSARTRLADALGVIENSTGEKPGT